MCPFHQNAPACCQRTFYRSPGWYTGSARWILRIDPRPSAEATTYFLSRRFGSSGGLSFVD